MFRCSVCGYHCCQCSSPYFKPWPSWGGWQSVPHPVPPTTTRTYEHVYHKPTEEFAKVQKSEKCETCRYWKGGGKRGRCMRYPPYRVQGDDGMVGTFWSITEKTDWCGEYEPQSPQASETRDY